MNWRGTASGEGGPLIVLDQDAAWTGTTPLRAPDPRQLGLFPEPPPARPVDRFGSAYDAACAAVRADERAWMFQGHLLWDMTGSGVVDVGTRHREVLLVRTWVNSDELNAIALQRATDSEGRPTHLVLATRGALRVLWAPVSVDDLSRSDGRLHTDGIRGVGLDLQVEPGTYAVRVGWDEGAGWMATWCRLVGTGAAASP